MPKHIPERTCVACRTPRPKRHLVRLVRLADGTVEVDTTWRKPGRGAYLCPAQECWQLAAKRKCLDHEFKVTLTPQTWQVLNVYAQGLPLHRHDTSDQERAATPPRAAQARQAHQHYTLRQHE